MSTEQTSHIEAPARNAAEHAMATWDGAEIFYRAWQPATPSGKALLLFHRGHEHSGRFQDFVDRAKLDDFWIFAWDARGHGRTEGERGYAESVAALVRDVDCFVRHISQQFEIPVENMAIVANSIGAVLVSTWVHDYAPRLRAMVLVTPALRVKLYVPFAITGLRLLQRVKGKAFVKSYVRPTMLTHDAAMVEEYAGDPLISRNIAVNILLQMYDTSTRLLADAAAITTPTLVLSAGSDWVVRHKPQRRFFESLSSSTKEFETYDGFYHAVLHESERDRPIERIREFIDDAFARPLEEPILRDSDQGGPSKDAFDRLSAGNSWLSPSGFYYWATKLVLKTLGRLSEGVRIGWREGFNSGKMLDHVYRNEARGLSPLGRWADRLYLDSPGWSGIRQRKVLVEETLQLAFESIQESGRKVQLLDIAAGPGRYVLDALVNLGENNVTALLRDRNAEALEAGRKLAAARELANVKFEQGDALNEQELSAIRPRPNVAIVSGLYELLPDNQRVSASLRGLLATIENDGLLIYTNQPWHPQLELIARSLTGMDGLPWVMRCRTQREIDQLVEAAGFRKLQTRVTDNGIFTVSLARRMEQP